MGFTEGKNLRLKIFLISVLLSTLNLNLEFKQRGQDSKRRNEKEVEVDERL